MAQSLSHLIVHAVFSTKDRRALLRSEEIRRETYSYMAGILKNLQCHPIKIGGADDHVHSLSSLSKASRLTQAGSNHAACRFGHFGSPEGLKQNSPWASALGKTAPRGIALKGRPRVGHYSQR